jgi:hypothetical protein
MDILLENFLNSLGEAERAGGRILHELIDQAYSLELCEMLRKVAHDEGYYAGEVAAHVRRLGGTPSNKTGDFVDKVRNVPDFKGRLELLNRGQRWVVRKISEHLNTIDDDRLRAFLKLMGQNHDANITALEKALDDGSV